MPSFFSFCSTRACSFVFVIPPAIEQIAIATFLDRETAKIDALVEEQRRLIELLILYFLVGGVAVARLGRTRSLLLGSALVIISNDQPGKDAVAPSSRCSIEVAIPADRPFQVN